VRTIYWAALCLCLWIPFTTRQGIGRSPVDANATSMKLTMRYGRQAERPLDKSTSTNAAHRHESSVRLANSAALLSRRVYELAQRCLSSSVF
jgi:hypothetical protein